MTGLLADAFLGGPVRFPRPLEPGDVIGVTAPSGGVIGVTAPSGGVPDELRPRLDFCVEHLCGLGFEVAVGECVVGSGITSAPAPDRAAELTAMLLDPPGPRGGAAVGRGAGHRPAAAARLRGPRRRGADLAGRLLRHQHAARAPDPADRRRDPCTRPA